MSDAVQDFVTAVKANDLVAVRSLLAAHAELRSRINDPLPGFPFDATALLAALWRGQRDMVDLLLAEGADINRRSHWWAGGFGVLDGDPALAPFLIERGAIVDVHAASRLDMLDRLHELISANPTLVRARGGDGQTPLHVAASIRVAEYLLDRGADIDARDVDHESTPAQYLVRDRQEVVRYLVGRGCRTDLLMASALGDLELVRRHLDADPASIRTTVSAEYFPMQDARAGGSIYIWTLGANKMAHSIAREFGHEDVVRLLMDRSPDALRLAAFCELGDEAAVRELLQRRRDLVETLTEDVRQRVVRAAQDNRTEAVRLMLESGWPIDVRGQHRGTPLHFAAWNGNVEMVRDLLHRHAPVDVRGDEFDLSPLGWALHGSRHCSFKDTGDYAGVVRSLSAGWCHAAFSYRERRRQRGGYPRGAEIFQTDVLSVRFATIQTRHLIAPE